MHLSTTQDGLQEALCLYREPKGQDALKRFAFDCLAARPEYLANRRKIIPSAQPKRKQTDKNRIYDLFRSQDVNVKHLVQSNSLQRQEYAQLTTDHFWARLMFCIRQKLVENHTLRTEQNKEFAVLNNYPSLMPQFIRLGGFDAKSFGELVYSVIIWINKQLTRLECLISGMTARPGA